MANYNEYVTSINKIFDYLAKMKTGMNSLDNKNYIESIEEYKQTVIRVAEQLKNSPQQVQHKDVESLEALGND